MAENARMNDLRRQSFIFNKYDQEQEKAALLMIDLHKGDGAHPALQHPGHTGLRPGENPRLWLF
jgi:hypothetical protein